MRTRFFAILALLLCFSALGCAKMPGRGDYVKEAEAPVITPTSDTGTVTFFRTGILYVGAGASYFVKEDGVDIGAMKYDTYFVRQATPGYHVYSAATETEVNIPLTVEAGKSYYIQCGLSIGFNIGHPTMRMATEQEFAAAKPDLEYIRLTSAHEREDFKEKEKREAASSNNMN